MDDSCAVCAETLEWVAYGGCGHKDVCSTCVARLRFICDDRRCCICKTESDVVFVTKALGDYTTLVTDFSNFPSQPKEGKISQSYWYHEDTQAFFDDFDHYRMIKAMCNLSCTVCGKIEENPQIRYRFKNINQLKSHLFHEHKLLMCSLCLEGRKVFICEQKLYTRLELNQHISNGDSAVDGDEFERGGFSGHPMCEFCKSHFYGDSDLYTHMSTEHFTCHICQRQHPGQYEYYANYDDLEMHFRHGHFLCEVEACLEKKFIVFQTQAELKRHNTLEHGGNMSRSMRNAALRIPVSFRFRRTNERDSRSGLSGSSNHDFDPSSSDSHPTAYDPLESWPSLSSSSNSSSVSVPTSSQLRPSTSYAESFPSISASYQRQSYNQRNQRQGSIKKNQGQSSPLINRIGSTSSEDNQNAKKSLVRSIQKELDNDPCRFTSFKNICKDYRDGILDAEAYLEYIKRFGLSRFVPEIANTCPDAQKQHALIQAYNASLSGSRKKKDKHLSSGSHVRESNNPWRDGGGKKIIASDSRGKNKGI